MLFNCDNFKNLGLKEKALVFIDGIPVNHDFCSECYLGDDGYVLVTDLNVLVDREKNIVLEKKIKGKVSIQLKDNDIDGKLLDSYGLKIETKIYHEQDKHLLVKK